MENNNFILNPASIANGSITRSAITEQFTESAKQNGLLPLDKLRFYRETSKAATDAEKVKENPEDKKCPTLMELALKQAKSLKEFKQAMRNGSKEFPYNGCTYQYREEVTIDLSKCEGPYAEDWQLQQSVIENIDRQIAALRNEQKAAKSAMEADGKNYLSENPECDKVKVTKKPSLVVL